MRIGIGADIAARLVEHDIDFALFGENGDAVIFDPVAGGDPESRFEYGFAVDGNAAGLDQVSGAAPGGDPGGT